MTKFVFFKPTLTSKMMTVEGEIDINQQENSCEITDTLAEILSANGFGKIVEMEQDPEEAANEEDGEKLDGNQSDANEEDVSEDSSAEQAAPTGDQEPEMTNEELLKELLRKDLKTLQGIAVDSELPQDEWGNMNKMNLAKYLVEKSSTK